ncbi:Xaa-Pro peptidase family protein [Georgenia sp. EYE_87]|uniref:M24 family metallopeptidase n=1 Tax=Georgenia sp. EYE_87 TaxID=2853448 RepID=UPI0020050E73|nr:Xaa-Pro peptidase family protein [Georgenia sp. EYE_87]MCK6211482.1 Xaa-Pro peptidase family protein [Georgenia sp. EYE_87]
MRIPPPGPTPDIEFEDRQYRLRSLMAIDQLDLLVCYGDAWRTANIRYFTDFRPVDGINGIEQAVLLFPLAGEPELFVADGCLDAALEVTPFVVRPLNELPGTNAQTFGAWKPSSVGVAGAGQMPAPIRTALDGVMDGYGVKETDVLARTKAVKSEWEVGQLQHAATLTDVAMSRLEEIVTSGELMSERDLAREADIAMIRAGADGVAFLSMVQSGPRSSYSLALPSHRTPQPGDLVLTDIGARYGNYVADGGRGFTVGEVSDEVMDVVEASVSAVEAGLAFARPGITASALNRQIQSVLIERGYGDYSIEARGRGTGHGTGMDPEEEMPWIGPTNEEVLRPNMVFTLKATINKPGVGGLRTERLVHLTDAGGTPLDRFPMRNHW